MLVLFEPSRTRRDTSFLFRTDTSESTHDARFFNQLCGEYSLNPEQFGVFVEFSRSMRQCTLAFLCVSVSNIILTLLQVGPSGPSTGLKTLCMNLALSRALLGAGLLTAEHL
jgi:hypothetical protein